MLSDVEPYLTAVSAHVGYGVPVPVMQKTHPLGKRRPEQRAFDADHRSIKRRRWRARPRPGRPGRESGGPEGPGPGGNRLEAARHSIPSRGAMPAGAVLQNRAPTPLSAQPHDHVSGGRGRQCEGGGRPGPRPLVPPSDSVAQFRELQPLRPAPGARCEERERRVQGALTLSGRNAAADATAPPMLTCRGGPAW